MVGACAYHLLLVIEPCGAPNDAVMTFVNLDAITGLSID
ncbi:MAG: hypothetical protein QOJ04_186 [Caballeronia sp.]|jgi:hypothetical protein|nr:hypothetical protein [Caballeronia sp.]